MSEYITVSTDLQENLRAADRLVNIIGAQRDEVERAYQRGWRECGEALAYAIADAFEAGRADMKDEIDATWAEVAERSHFLGSPMSRTHAEKRAEELERIKPRPGDFPGVEQDPQCIERCRASVEAIARHPKTRAAATLAGLLRSVLQADAPDRSRRLRWAADKTFEHAAHGLFEAETAAQALMEAATAAGIDEGAAQSLISSAYRSTTKGATS
ncbi:hypothetical protein [Catenulispora sp. MAP12-49]|uniref:hypothetical protein n=1 Tax=Catenulispora sp. MAP12-49 TaxID=3156302 RepID=UPI003511A05B